MERENQEVQGAENTDLGCILSIGVDQIDDRARKDKKRDVGKKDQAMGQPLCIGQIRQQPVEGIHGFLLWAGGPFLGVVSCVASFEEYDSTSLDSVGRTESSKNLIFSVLRRHKNVQIQ